MRQQPASAVLRWMSVQTPENLHITSITIAEVLYGVELLPAGKRQDSLRGGAEKLFQALFADRILSFGRQEAREFSTIAASRRKRGRHIAKLDAQIAAIARAHNATLATRHTNDFDGCGVRLVNPWEG